MNDNRFNLHEGDHLRTFSGLYIDVFNPNVDMVSMIDIAHGLSNVCRFAGQCSRFYSVAQHSVLVAADVITGERKIKQMAILHDASEAYIGDMPKPIKKHFPNYQAVEENLMYVIFEKFGLSYAEYLNVYKPMIKEADKKALEFEHKTVMLNENNMMHIWKPEEAKQRFMNNVSQLFNEPFTIDYAVAYTHPISKGVINLQAWSEYDAVEAVKHQLSYNRTIPLHTYEFRTEKNQR